MMDLETSTVVFARSDGKKLDSRWPA